MTAITVIAAHGYNLEVGNVSGERGSSVSISMTMNNETDITAFECQISLPQGLEFVSDEDDEYEFSLSSRATVTHQLLSAKMSSGNIKVESYSSSSKAFFGNSGELFTGTLNLNGAPGTYTVTVTDIELVDLVAKAYSCPEFTFIVSILDRPVGFPL